MKTYNGKVENSLYYCAKGICQSCHYRSESDCKRSLIKDVAKEEANDQRTIESQRITIMEQNAEIEKYENIKTTINEFWDILLKVNFAKRKESPTLEELADALAEMQTEAIKEFWNRLKAAKFIHTNLGEFVYVEDGDNLVKEMTEEGR